MDLISLHEKYHLIKILIFIAFQNLELFDKN